MSQPGAQRPAAAGDLAGSPHAAAVLGPVLAGTAPPSHAYLFHGPAGAGKRDAARRLAAALLAEGAARPEGVAERVRRESHPDLTWVRPSGAAEMLVVDVAEPVVSAATRTPFESSRRVFVIEAAETMNDQAANRLLKTLEEPPPFVHLILISDRPQDVLATIVSRCQRVRFDAPAAEQIETRLEGVPSERARACARLAMGDAGLARRLAGGEGERLRAAAEAFAAWVLEDGRDAERPWSEMLEAAREAGAQAGEEAGRLLAEELELLPARERRRHEREGLEARRRGERRARTAALDLALQLAELWMRDALCVCEGAPEVVYAVDRAQELERAAGAGRARLEHAIERISAARLGLSLNVSEELAVDALAYELRAPVP